MKLYRWLASGILSAMTTSVAAVARFPKPDFTSGYEYPNIEHTVPMEQLWNWVDILLLVVMMSVVAWSVHRKRSRATIVGVSLFSVLYYGFFRSGCVCSVGSIQNVVLAFADSGYQLPLYVLLIFLLPIIFTLLFGRVFCAGVCPLGALQEVVNVRNFRLSRAVASALSMIPWIYLAFTILYAATRSQFLICKFDPFIGIFRLGGDMGMIVFGVILLLLSVVMGRPFCRFLCPYGALLSVFSSVSWKKVEVTKKACINCRLCHEACPVDAIRPPYANKVKEERSAGVRRLLLYFVLLPVITCLGAFLVGSNSDALSRAHKDVHLLDLIEKVEQNPEMDVPFEVVTFNAQGRNVEELKTEVATIQRAYRFYSYLIGALIGFVLAIKLIQLSVKRTRKTYEIEDAHCVACGKCFNYCPQEIGLARKSAEMNRNKE